MKSLWPPLLLAAILLAAGSASAQKGGPPSLPPQYQKWLDEEVVYLITPVEKKVFLVLRSDRERDLFIQAFWKKRDPNPLSEINEFKEEHDKRIDYANRTYGRISALPGWKTDRGRIYIILGPPISTQYYDNLSSIYPAEVWSYQGMSRLGLPDAFDIVFYKHRGVSDYRLYSPSADGPESLVANFSGTQMDAEAAVEQIRSESPELAQVALSLIPGEATIGATSLTSDRLLADINTAPQKAVQDAYAEEFLRYKDIVEVEYSANYIGNESLVVPIRDPAGIVFVNYLVELDRFSVDLVYGKYFTKIDIIGNVTDKSGKIVFQYQRSLPIEMDQIQFDKVKSQTYSFQDLFPLTPGEYKLSLLVKNESSKEFTSVEKDLSVPDGSTLTMGDLILSFKSEAAVADRKKAFAVGGLQLYPAPLGDFGRSDDLTVFFQILGLNQELRRDGSLRLVITQAGKEVQTWERPLSEQASPDSFVVTLSTAGIPPGYYEIRASLLDQGKSEILGKDGRFIISPAAALPRPWVHAIVHKPVTDPAYLAMIGDQLLKKSEFSAAKETLERAYHRKPDSPQLAMSLCEAYLNLKDYGSIEAILGPFSEKDVPEVLELLGRAYNASGTFDKAIPCFTSHIAHFGPSYPILTILGECYYKTGNKEDAIRAWEKSLEMYPNQPDLGKLLDSARKKRIPSLPN
jgi:GWxTD domain-containing protein